MKITITEVGKGWTPPNAAADFKPIYRIHLLGYGEPQTTQDPALTVPGEHEAETYQTKSGKTYWRKAGASVSAPVAQVAETATAGQQPATKWRDDDAIRAQWAIGRAVEMSIANGKLDMAGIEVDADKLFAMVDRVKQGPPPIIKQDRGDFASIEEPPIEAYDE